MIETRYIVRYGKKAQKALKKMDNQRARLILVWISKHLEGTNNLRFIVKGNLEIKVANGESW